MDGLSMTQESRNHWKYTEDELPPERVVLETTNSQGDVSELVRVGNLFFFKDMSMYVYYTPRMWRVKE